jgi:predicted Zn-ribbon and HTH transcriptional regulator
MKTAGRCPKCKGEVIKRIPGENQSKIGVPTGMLSWVPVTRYICTKCGFIEEYVEGADALRKVARA